jgi:GxxExxY protein
MFESGGEFMNENQIGTTLLDICYRVHQEMGPGLFESVYEDILYLELRNQGLKVEKQKEISVQWNGMKLEKGFRADLVIAEKVIVEIKSVDAISKLHFMQVLNYLKLADLKLGYLINFNNIMLKDGIHRIINGKISG